MEIEEGSRSLEVCCALSDLIPVILARRAAMSLSTSAWLSLTSFWIPALELDLGRMDPGKVYLVDFVPVLGILGFFSLGLPFWYISFYKFAPEFCIVADELWARNLEGFL